jgi:hypothetical protein
MNSIQETTHTELNNNSVSDMKKEIRLLNNNDLHVPNTLLNTNSNGHLLCEDDKATAEYSTANSRDLPSHPSFDEEAPSYVPEITTTPPVVVTEYFTCENNTNWADFYDITASVTRTATEGTVLPVKVTTKRKIYHYVRMVVGIIVIILFISVLPLIITSTEKNK